MHATLPAAIQNAFHLAGVVPVLVAGLNAEAYLSSQAKVNGQPVLLVRDDLDDDRLAVIVDQTLAAAVDRLDRAAREVR